ncbi:adenosylcobinamide-GDP ribazoletransferase [Fulvimarina endophytica]|uniref:Adenosylcobinamide-GDP ribazoletransferase n=1 Tax=Fulvimarina endophytica TaxID=2293836 RepID=A0A371X0X0_9HYPH|nr:adenosylcobinamide-GDP ribazoletransferase [Fulvimarina endophytica]RFC62882.1 adenosylcobinamide-GDP ribazoletransferase [Fulvimarina endophytica]
MTAPFSPLLRSISFLTRLPVPASAFGDGSHPLGDDAWTFPLAGLVAILPSVIVLLALSSSGLSVEAVALAAIAVSIVVTGALHEDGLADVADGLFGHLPRERALEVMKDSRVGTYGALALVLSCLGRTLFLAQLVAVSPLAASLALLGLAALGRGLMAGLWASLPPAAPGGIADRAGRPSRRTGRLASGLGMLIFAVLAWPASGFLAMLTALVVAAATFVAFRRCLERRLGGQTGDTLGALQQIVEAGGLLTLCCFA